jgi:hypothetical protein
MDKQGRANGTLTKDRLQLPVGWIITSLFSAGDLIGITANYLPGDWVWTGRRSRSAVFFWDGSSNQFNTKVMTPDTELRASYNLNGDFYILGKDVTGQGTIRKWNGTKFELVQEIIDNAGAFAKSPPINFGGIDEFRNCLIFPSSYNKVYTYGSAKPGLPPALTNIVRTHKSNAQCRGIKVTTAGAIVLSYYDSAANVYWLSSYSGNFDNFLYKSLYYEFPQRARINYIKLYFKTLASGQGDDILLDLDYGKTQIHAGNISYAEDGAITEKKLGVNRECDNFRVVIQKDEGAGIKYGKIVIDYDILSGDIK